MDIQGSKKKSNKYESNNCKPGSKKMKKSPEKENLVTLIPQIVTHTVKLNNHKKNFKLFVLNDHIVTF